MYNKSMAFHVPDKLDSLDICSISGMKNLESWMLQKLSDVITSGFSTISVLPCHSRQRIKKPTVALHLAYNDAQ